MLPIRFTHYSADEGNRLNIVRALLETLVSSSPSAFIGDPLTRGFPIQSSGMTVFFMRLLYSTASAQPAACASAIQ